MCVRVRLLFCCHSYASAPAATAPSRTNAQADTWGDTLFETDSLVLKATTGVLIDQLVQMDLTSVLSDSEQAG